MSRASRWLRPWTVGLIALALAIVGGVAVGVVANAAENDSTTIVGERDGRCLDGGSDTSPVGTSVRQRRCSDSDPQSWRFVPASSGGYTVINDATDRCLDVRSGSVDENAGFITWTCHGGPNQRFELRAVGAGTVQIVAVHSGKCVTVADAYAAATQVSCVAAASAAQAGQSWRVADGPSASPTATATATTGNPPPGGSLANVVYPASDAAITNPERGFMHFADCSAADLSATTLRGHRTEGISQVFCMYYLKSFKTADIDAATLQRLQRQFDTIRSAGLKTVMRFAYTDSPAGDDAAPSQVLRHIAQLKPYFQNNADVISVVQAGFIGAWGEWYYTANFGQPGQVSATDRTNRLSVLNALLDALPPSRTVQLRTPAIKRDFYGTQSLPADQAFNGSAASRVGHHNDCFLASPTDFGTYLDPAVEYPYLAAETRYLAMGGETCAVNAPRSQCPTALAELAQFHWSYLNADYQPDVLNSWRTGGCMPEVQRRLGYRFTLTDGSFTTTTTRGGGVQVRIGVRNDGWAAPYNSRPAQLVLRSASGTIRRVPLTTDPRRWLPGTNTIQQTVTLPGDLPAGTYQLFLALPDAAPSLADRPDYAIQTANNGLWDATGGYNDLRHTLTVTG